MFTKQIRHISIKHKLFLFQSLSTRFLSAFWWLFCTIILVLYIVSLGSSVLNQMNRKSEPDLNWLIRSEETKLVALHNGATAALLKVSL
jgi:hypothetical protein